MFYWKSFAKYTLKTVSKVTTFLLVFGQLYQILKKIMIDMHVILAYIRHLLVSWSRNLINLLCLLQDVPKTLVRLRSASSRVQENKTNQIRKSMDAFFVWHSFAILLVLRWRSLEKVSYSEGPFLRKYLYVNVWHQFTTF